ncbi:Extracellular exo-alpha-(1-_5)-L-arabinofuranosidase [Paenibacillus allorhizoplanae]|uniref:Extracellular exo-alpha-(1->5)-L-arabinofuranosidase n=1 Tax=Paenibacillus allorhizoplanae TaxID=2905648 RepID=A0ABN8G4L0_9BACL|nr:glycoside hydrolase family 43 protein [Paenibacillus allorhizoplanae]CAH1195540.1 Extracellular exo-alpha-(1->5)-L-arabinofuranosidase [Paenibacillus allorhizoplanae]
MWKLSIVCLSLMILAGCTKGVAENKVKETEIVVSLAKDAKTFTNPIIDNGADPWVTTKDGTYYYTHTTGNSIRVWKSKTLTGLADAEYKDVWFPPTSGPNTSNIWAPELHFIAGKWYIYYAADDGQNENHRMFVLESVSDDPLGAYVDKGMMDTAGRWAIDGTTLQKKDGSLYFIWSGWEGAVNVSQHLYIAPMSNPYTISGKPVEISRPTYDWELVGNPTINEGPQVLLHGDRIHVIYSASGSWTDDYCLGILSTAMSSDVLNPASWKKGEKAVFSKTDQVFGPGHNSFTKSVDGKEDWILYHAAKTQGSGWNRNVRMQPFQWNKDGTPNFGTPIAEGVPIPVPGGE